MDLEYRLASAGALLIILVAVLLAGPIFVGILLVAVAILATRELDDLLKKMNEAPFTWMLFPLSVWLAVRMLLGSSSALLDDLMIGLAIAAVIGVVAMGGKVPKLIPTFAGAIYVGACLGFFAGLYQLQAHPFNPAFNRPTDHIGIRLVVVALVGPILNDTAAYFVGSKWGSLPFFAHISPHKTMEGATAGLAASLIGLTIVAPLILGMDVGQAALLGLLVGVAAQAGDLLESKLKRAADVKDSGTLIPGHGGMLDRIDSLLIVAPIVYLFVVVTAAV